MGNDLPILLKKLAKIIEEYPEFRIIFDEKSVKYFKYFAVIAANGKCHLMTSSKRYQEKIM